MTDEQTAAQRIRRLIRVALEDAIATMPPTQSEIANPPTQSEIEERFTQILLDDLFTTGTGEKAKYLVLELEDGRDGGGWSRAAVARCIRRAFDAVRKRDD